MADAGKVQFPETAKPVRKPYVPVGKLPDSSPEMPVKDGKKPHKNLRSGK